MLFLTSERVRIALALLQVGLGPSSNAKVIVELRPVRHQSSLTNSGSLLLHGR